MSLAIMDRSATALFPPTSGFFSPTANFVHEQNSSWIDQIRETNVFGSERNLAMDELRQTYEECRTPNWDGFDAQAVVDEVFFVASEVLDSLPLGMRAPTVAAEPDGHLTLEWYRSPSRTLSLSISPSRDIHYAALLGARKAYGSEPFYEALSSTIVDLINQVMSE